MSLVIDQSLQAGTPAAAASRVAFQPQAESGHWLAALLDQVDYGLVVLDETAAALHANRAARECLSSPGAPLRLRAGRLEAVAAQDAGLLRRALASAVLRGWRALLAFGEGGEGIAAALGPLTGSGCTPPGLAAMVIGRRHVCNALTAQMFASRHGLTHAEARVLDLLCGGLTPREIARRQSVALSTVRTHVGSIRAKTRARSIGTLVREVSLLPPSGHALAAGAAPAIH